jgi:hypothetical protein
VEMVSSTPFYSESLINRSARPGEPPSLKAEPREIPV